MPFADQVGRVQRLFRLNAFDVSTPEGRSSERYRRAALTSVSAGLAKAISAGTVLVSVPLTFRYLGAERYGLWMVLTSIISIMAFADFGIGNGLMNAVSDAYGKDNPRLAKEYVSSGLFLMIGIAACFAIAGGIAYRFLPWMRLFNVNSPSVADEGARAFLVLFSLFVINIPLSVVTKVQAGLQKGYWSQLVGALGNVLSLIGLIVVIKLRASLAWLVFASTFGITVAIVVNGWLLLREFPELSPSPDAYSARSASRICRLGLMFFVLQCAVAVGFTSDNIVIAQVMGAAAVAAYAVPQKLFGFVSILVSICLNPLWPAYGEALSRGDLDWVRRVFRISLRMTMLISIPICTFLVCAGSWILKVAVGKQLHASTALLVTLALWAVVSSVSGAIAVLLNGAGVLKAQTVLAGIASATNLILSIALTRRLGVIGVCLGSLITQVVIVFPADAVIIRNIFRKMATGELNSSFQ